MLARREHSEKELCRKLTGRDFNPDEVARVITQLKQEGLQSDRRFTDALVHNRIEKGYGPAWIARELREKGVSDDLIADALHTGEVDWFACAIRVREKKYGRAKPDNYREQARQSRFLQYRGFSGEQIRGVFDDCD